MKKTEIPFYTDPDDFDGHIDNKFPCDTEFMVYNPLMHRYYLTEAGLSQYNIDFGQYITSSTNNAAEELIQKTSKKVYDYIQYKAGRTCYQIMLYRIAAAPTSIYPDKYYTRKQFEEALADQARYIVENGDSARYSRANVDSETGETVPIKPEDALRDTSDIAPETMRTLETLGLTRWFKVAQTVRLDPTKY